jgi:hypothetical protein
LHLFGNVTVIHRAAMLTIHTDLLKDIATCLVEIERAASSNEWSKHGISGNSFQRLSLSTHVDQGVVASARVRSGDTRQEVVLADQQLLLYCVWMEKFGIAQYPHSC